MSYITEVADATEARVYLITADEAGVVEESCLTDDWREGCADHEHAFTPDPETPVLVIENGSSHRYVITGDLDGFARKVVETIHGPAKKTAP